MPRTNTDEQPPYEVVILAIFFVAAFATLAVIMMGAGQRDSRALGAAQPFGPEDFALLRWDDFPAADANAAAQGGAFPVPPPPFADEDMFPCTECHDEDLEPDPTRRELQMAHQEIKLDHGAADRWCFDCHNPDDRDKLRLVSGELIEFKESYRLCGQCHGTIYRDWRSGIHGLRRGRWNGEKTYLLCAHCHDPHAPRFRPLKPLPPPVRPQFMDPDTRNREGAPAHGE